MGRAPAGLRAGFALTTMGSICWATPCRMIIGAVSDGWG